MLGSSSFVLPNFFFYKFTWSFRLRFFFFSLSLPLFSLTFSSFTISFKFLLHYLCLLLISVALNLSLPTFICVYREEGISFCIFPLSRPYPLHPVSFCALCFLFPLLYYLYLIKCFPESLFSFPLYLLSFSLCCLVLLVLFTYTHTHPFSPVPIFLIFFLFLLYICMHMPACICVCVCVLNVYVHIHMHMGEIRTGKKVPEVTAVFRGWTYGLLLWFPMGIL